MVVCGIAAGPSGKFVGVFFWEASIGKWRAVSNHMMVNAFMLRERLQFQPLPIGDPGVWTITPLLVLSVGGQNTETGRHRLVSLSSYTDGGNAVISSIYT